MELILSLPKNDQLKDESSQLDLWVKCLLTALTLIKLTCLPGFSVNGFSRHTRWTAICFVCHTPPPPPHPPPHTHPPHTLDAIAVTQAAFGAGEGPVYLNGVRCLGNEADLLDCPSSGVGVQLGCTHSQDAGVYCTGEWKTDTVVICTY